MEAQAWCQFEFFRQWLSLKQYANSRGIQIFGDIPIFVAMDSADVWTHPSLFEMDSNLNPRGVAGVPPDYFAADGQLWGNPLYDWKRHKATNYAWWLARLRASFELYDIVRVDHFRGFDEYCKIPANAENAREYEWVPGPGLELFESIKAQFPEARLVAEDLGIITDSVRELVVATGVPGMNVLQFGFEGATEYLPHNGIPNSVLYPGTHDNDTAWGWFNKSLSRSRISFDVTCGCPAKRALGYDPGRLRISIPPFYRADARSAEPGKRGPDEHARTGRRQLAVAPYPRTTGQPLERERRVSPGTRQALRSLDGVQEFRSCRMERGF